MPELTDVDPRGLTSPARGHPVATARSSWTRRIALGGHDCFVKTYDYPTRRDRRRGALRTTWIAASRAAREAAASDWLASNGFASAHVLGVVEWRVSLGFLRRCAIVTEAWPGAPLDRIYAAADDAGAAVLADAVTSWVAALHRRGFRDRNLDPRNILVAEHPGGGLQFCKIDSPRHRIVTTGAGDDRLARADRRRLLAGLAALRLPRVGADPTGPPPAPPRRDG